MSASASANGEWWSSIKKANTIYAGDSSSGFTTLTIPKYDGELNLFLVGGGGWTIANPNKTKIRKIWVKTVGTDPGVDGDIKGVTVVKLLGNSSGGSCIDPDDGTGVSVVDQIGS